MVDGWQKYVLKLLEVIDDNRQRNIYFDGWFSSINLMKKLSSKGYLNTTIFRNNALYLTSKIKNDSKVNAYKDEIIIQKFKNKKAILFGTNYNIKVNDLKENYNKFNLGVGVFIQKLQITSMQRKTVKWYKKVILFGIESSIISSKIICGGLYGEKENTNKYKERIILYIYI